MSRKATGTIDLSKPHSETSPTEATSWALDRPESLPRGLQLVGYEKIGNAWGVARGLNLAELRNAFGRRDDKLVGLSWEWVDGALECVEDAELGGAALVSTTLGARVPLTEVPRLMGLGLTREGLAALGLLTVAPPQLSVLVDAKEAARLMGISEDAFRQRVQRGDRQLLAATVRAGRTRRRVQFVRTKLPGVGSK